MSNWWDTDPVANSQASGPDFAGAISSIESGGNYRALGPQTGKGRALGKYQVMDFNVGPWSEKVLGRRLTPEQFLADDKAQDQIFEGVFGNYVKKYGPEGAAKAWFGGERGMNNPNARDILGTTVASYANKFNNRVGNVAASAQSKNWWGADPVAGEAQAEPETPMVATPEAAQFQRPPAATITVAPGAKPAPMSGPQQMAIQHGNILSAASQGATPNVDILGKNLISSEVFEGDDGSILFRDPQSGQVTPTNNTQHIVMRDPADNTPKVYARTNDALENPAVGVARVLAPGLMAGAPTARAAIPATNRIQPKASDIFATAKPSYREFDKIAKAEPLKGDVSYAARLRAALEGADFIDEQAKPVFAVIDVLKRIEDGGKATVADLQKIKKIAGKSFGSADKPTRDAAAVAVKEVMRMIGEASKPAAQALKSGDEIHSTALAVQDLQRKAAVAGLRKGRAGYGGNAVNSMRQVLSPIVEKDIKGLKTLYKPDEIQAMREIVEGTEATNALRLVGMASPSKGALSTIGGIGAGVTGAATGFGGLGFLIPALGAASNKLATVLQGKQIERLAAQVAKRSPMYAEAVARAVTRYEQAQMQFVNNPTANTLAAYIGASRALSSGLTKDGIEITSGTLLKAIQAPVKSAAEGDEPAVPWRPGQ
jgi:hypothetical protein